MDVDSNMVVAYHGLQNNQERGHGQQQAEGLAWTQAVQQHQRHQQHQQQGLAWTQAAHRHQRHQQHQQQGLAWTQAVVPWSLSSDSFLEEIQVCLLLAREHRQWLEALQHHPWLVEQWDQSFSLNTVV